MKAVMSFPEQIAQSLDQLTTAQQALAKYILDHGEQVAFMTARQLANAAGQSDAAVVRFAKAVGYGGYPELRDALREGLLERVGSSGMSQRHDPATPLEELCRQVYAIDGGLIQETALLNSDAQLLSAADALVAARRIWVTGHGTSSPLAQYLAMHLNQVLGNAQVLNVGDGDLAERLRGIGKQDAVIGIGYVRYLPYTVDILQIARESGAAVLAITDRVSSPLARLAHHPLYTARAKEAAAWWSQTGTLTLANLLTSLVMAKAPKVVAEHLRHADAVWQRLGHWQSTGNSSSDPSLQQRHAQGMRAGPKRRAK